MLGTLPATRCAALASLFAALALALLTSGSAQEPPGDPKPVARPASPRSPAIPEAERSRRNPIPATPETLEAGRILFTTQCSMCHGVKGDGKGDLVHRLHLEVPNFTDSARQQKRTDGELFYILGHGHGDMPAEERLVEHQLWKLVLYIRSLARPQTAPAAPR